MEEQANAAYERDHGAEIGQHLARAHGPGHSIPCRSEMACDQAHYSEADHGRSKDRVPQACDAHRPSLSRDSAKWAYVMPRTQPRYGQSWSQPLPNAHLVTRRAIVDI